MSLARLQLITALLVSGVTLYEAGYWSLALYDLLTVGAIFYYFNGKRKFICNTCFSEIRARNAPAKCHECDSREMEWKRLYQARSKISSKIQKVKA